MIKDSKTKLNVGHQIYGENLLSKVRRLTSRFLDTKASVFNDIGYSSILALSSESKSRAGACVALSRTFGVNRFRILYCQISS